MSTSIIEEIIDWVLKANNHIYTIECQDFMDCDENVLKSENCESHNKTAREESTSVNKLSTENALKS